MGKYDPLAERLRRHQQSSWTATFIEVEKVLGFPLPQSARTYREWWGNQRNGGHSQTRGWQDAGWQVWKVDLPGEQVTFKRLSSEPSPRSGATDPDTEDKLIERASELLGIENREQIVREALRALIQREAARRLASLGGTMPDFMAPPRRRLS